MCSDWSDVKTIPTSKSVFLICYLSYEYKIHVFDLRNFNFKMFWITKPPIDWKVKNFYKFKQNEIKLLFEITKFLETLIKYTIFMLKYWIN